MKYPTQWLHSGVLYFRHIKYRKLWTEEKLFPRYPLDIPIKIPGNTYTLCKRSHKCGGKKKQSGWHTLPELVIRKMWIYAGKLEVPHSRSLQNVKAEYVPSALRKKQNCTLTSILQMCMHCSYFLSPANPECMQYRCNISLSLHSPSEV